MKRYAVVLFLLAALAGQAQQVAPRTTAAATFAGKALTPAFKSAAEAALDAIDSAGSDDDAPEIVFATEYANARNELNHAKREVRTKQDAIAAQKLRVLFTSTGLCRLWRKTGVDYKECEARRVGQYDDAAAVIGAKTWETIDNMAGP